MSKGPIKNRADFVSRIKYDPQSTVSGRPYDFSEVPDTYFPMRSRITVICPDHGPWEAFAGSVLSSRCRKCAMHQQSLDRIGVPNNRRMSLKAALARAHSVAPDVDFSRVTSYTGGNQLWTLGCPEHGWFKAKAARFVFDGKRKRSRPCPKCVETFRKIQGGELGESQLNRFPEVVRERGYVVISYSSAHEPATLKCKEHGRFTVPRAYYINAGFICPSCRGSASRIEADLVADLRKVGIEKVQLHRRDLIGREIDIYLPQYRVGIEINSLWYHREESKGRWSHYTKTVWADERGISLLHFTDIELSSRRSLVISMIQAKCGLFKKRIYARKTTLEEIPYATAKAFLSKNHIQGSCAGRYYLGLYYLVGTEPKLVSVAVFGKPRFNRSYDWELIRSASLQHLQVVGALSKLMAFMKRKHQGQSIISYADRSYSSGASYEASGWEFVGNTKPSFIWCHRDGSIVPRYRATKKSMGNHLDTFDPSRSQAENMKANGFFRIWNSGNKLYRMVL